MSKNKHATGETEYPMTQAQADVLTRIEAQLARLNQEKMLALTMLLAGHGVTAGNVESIDLDNLVVRIGGTD